MNQWQWEPLDWKLADFLARFETGDADVLKKTVRMLSHQMRAGDTCLYLPDFAEQVLEQDDRLPDVASWSDALAACVSVGAEHRPLLLDREEGGIARLYFQRYWQYENRLAVNLMRLAKSRPDTPDADWLDKQLAALPLAHQQKQAIARSFGHSLCVISGGPGTGKTTTVSALVMLLKKWRPDLRIAMAAPTGKAAARMQSSVQGAADFLGLSEHQAAWLDHDATTLHRLLGFRYGRAGFRHHMENPLHADVVIVDEASMIDLALMSKLVDAVRTDARLVLLGDKDQLASVEAGEVMATLCGEQPENPLRDNVVTLDKVHRFNEHAGIARLAGAVNAGNGLAALEVLGSGEYPDAQLMDASDNRWVEELEQKVSERLSIDGEVSLGRFQLLCALRNGPQGVNGLNQWVENRLVRNGHIPPNTAWYAGRPVIITRNSPALQLYNGDIGVTVLQRDESGKARLRASFPGADSPRFLSTARLPQHETAWALTVHKSQGSEFDEVMLVLPDEMSPLLTRELIYTAATRARSRLTIVGNPEIFCAAVERRIGRHSGLAGRLRDATSTPAR